MAVAGLLAQYMSIKAQLSEAELQDTRYNNLETANSKKLSEQTKLEEKYENEYDKAEEAWNDPDKNLSVNGKEVICKGSKLNSEHPEQVDATRRVARGWSKNKEEFCKQYAKAKVPKFKEDAMNEYADLDMEYSTMVAMYDTLVEQLQAQADSTKNATSTESQDTHMIS